jgi:hypothetical protein
MKTLRHLGGILLGSIALLFGVGFLWATFDPQPDLPRWKALLFALTLGGLPGLCAAGLLKSSITVVRQRCCPGCGSDEQAPAGLMLKRSNWWAREFGGVILASLWGASREKQVRCVRCDHLYFTETRGTRIAGILLWMVVLWFIIAEVIDSLQAP